MSKQIKKLYLVKREVIATSIKNTLTTKGVVYEVQITDEKMWPDNKKKELGFKQNEKNLKLI
jgi:hypothetical protein